MIYVMTEAERDAMVEAAYKLGYTKAQDEAPADKGFSYFNYDGERREVKVVGVRAGKDGQALLECLEYWNTRDSLHAEPKFKLFAADRMSEIQGAVDLRRNAW